MSTSDHPNMSEHLRKHKSTYFKILGLTLAGSIIWHLFLILFNPTSYGLGEDYQIMGKTGQFMTNLILNIVEVIPFAGVIILEYFYQYKSLPPFETNARLRFLLYSVTIATINTITFALENSLLPGWGVFVYLMGLTLFYFIFFNFMFWFQQSTDRDTNSKKRNLENKGLNDGQEKDLNQLEKEETR